MASRFAGAQSTGSRTQHMEPPALPVLQEVDIVYETAYALDLQGRKHIDRASSESEYHLGQAGDAAPEALEFDMPGLASGDALRAFLFQHLRPEQVGDEYGVGCDVDDVSLGHMAVLQAKLWIKGSKSRGAVGVATQTPSRLQVFVAGHVSRIVQLLEEKHIFVLPQDSARQICNLGNFHTRSKQCQSQTIRIEPLVHWGTVTPASASQAHFMLPFRRDGVLMREPAAYPGYAQVVRRAAANAPGYCVDCLGYLWDECTGARESMRRLQSAVPQPRLRFSDEGLPPRPVLKRKEPGSVARDVDSLAVGGIMGVMACPIEAAADVQDHFGEVSWRTHVAHKPGTNSRSKALAQFDGASDHLHGASDHLHGASDHPNGVQTGHSSSNDRGSTAVWISSSSNEPMEKQTARVGPLRRRDSFTLALRTASLTPKACTPAACTPAAPTTKPCSIATKDAAAATEKSRVEGAVARDCRDIRIVDPTTPRAKERRFGQEVDANAKAPVAQVRKWPRNHKTTTPMSPAKRAAPVKPVKPVEPVEPLEPLEPVKPVEPLKPVKPVEPVKPMQKTKTTKEAKKRKTTREAKRQKTAPAGQQAGKQKRARTAAPKKPMALVDTAVFPETMLTVSLDHTPKPAATPPKLTVHFAKPPALQSTRADVAEAEWSAFHGTHPTRTGRICFCNQPACHGTFKKGEAPQIAQCVNGDCRFRWFHYACLDLAEKGRARWGTLVCCVCREVGERDGEKGCSGRKMVDLRAEWTRDDVDMHMPGLGGFVPRAHPYGLGVETQLGPEYARRSAETGCLCGLESLGYPRSRPAMLEAAYLHSDT
ncbi:uncharacterized protein M421DRAFT_96642 [Didymella exigua CBS 183.55]|uniref:Zinc finger PHD-type domain-containing protein n=1 Tax=Didymella exigua CBS 183.55 TaxID=1150837 RepID=A0A6A5R6V8_9PLEO|nr:uncharacterized protein M421DRAFT_96642 [Didymella exigua CBS 183.55]KAF1922714.1 hypothetical protein M421DRAFT_96642 [Didymella exigua CBS 183.55]